MPKSKKVDPKRTINHDQGLQEPNAYLKTENQHKDWYNVHEMGKLRGKPTALPREKKKPGGIKKHSLRKEK
jgi:hypothetical protein